MAADFKWVADRRVVDLRVAVDHQAAVGSARDRADEQRREVDRARRGARPVLTPEVVARRAALTDTESGPEDTEATEVIEVADPDTSVPEADTGRRPNLNGGEGCSGGNADLSFGLFALAVLAVFARRPRRRNGVR